MYVIGTASAIRRPPTLTSSVSDRSFCLRSLPPWRRARISTTSAPTLWRVLSHSSPGFPRPPTSRSAHAPLRGLRRDTLLPPPRLGDPPPAEGEAGAPPPASAAAS